MAPSEQKDLKTGKGSRGFDLGSIDALPNVDLAGGIFEAPGVIVSDYVMLRLDVTTFANIKLPSSQSLE